MGVDSTGRDQRCGIVEVPFLLRRAPQRVFMQLASAGFTSASGAAATLMREELHDFIEVDAASSIPSTSATSLVHIPGGFQ